MMATVPHVTSGLGLRKFQADGFLLTRLYNEGVHSVGSHIIYSCWYIKSHILADISQHMTFNAPPIANNMGSYRAHTFIVHRHCSLLA